LNYRARIPAALLTAALFSLPACGHSGAVPAVAPSDNAAQQFASRQSAAQMPSKDAGMSVIGTVDRQIDSSSHTVTSHGTVHDLTTSSTAHTTVYRNAAFNGAGPLFDVRVVTNATSSSGNRKETDDTYMTGKPDGDAFDYASITGGTQSFTTASFHGTSSYQRFDGYETSTFKDVPLIGGVPADDGQSTSYDDGSYALTENVHWRAAAPLPAYTETMTSTMNPNGSGSFDDLNDLTSFPAGAPYYDTLQSVTRDTYANVTFTLKDWIQPPNTAKPADNLTFKVSNWVPFKMRDPNPLSADTQTPTAKVWMPASCHVISGLPHQATKVVENFYDVDPLGGTVYKLTTTMYVVPGVGDACYTEQSTQWVYDLTNGSLSSTTTRTASMTLTATTFKPATGTAVTAMSAASASAPRSRFAPRRLICQGPARSQCLPAARE
jgi:hypothetical protein